MTDRLADIIAAHQTPTYVVVPGWPECSCGKWRSQVNLQKEHPAHVAQAIRAADPIIRYDEGTETATSSGRLDEFIADNAHIHFEAMGESEFWIGIVVGERRWDINCGATNPKAHGYATCEVEAVA